MSGYHAIASMLRVDRSDDCIWLVDERGSATQNIHMTPDQATSAGEALLEVGGSSSNSMSLPVAGLDMDAIVRDVVDAGIIDKLRRKKQPSKSVEQLIAEQNALLLDVSKKESERGQERMQEGIAAPWKELRKRFPK